MRKSWVWLSLPVAVLLTIAAGVGALVSGVYRDAPSYVAQARGQDLVSLLVVVPTFLITAWLAGRGSPRGQLVWAGVLVYLVYTYALAAFDTRLNSLFLVYVALLGCSLYALIGALGTADLAGIKSSFTAKTPVRAVSVYLIVLGVLFYFMWLNEIVPALLANQVPLSVQEDGTPTNAVHVLDMAWILPAFGIAAFTLWRRQALGYVLAGTLLSYVVLLVSAIMSMVLFMVAGGHPVVAAQEGVFGTVLALSVTMLIWFLRGSRVRPVRT